MSLAGSSFANCTASSRGGAAATLGSLNATACAFSSAAAAGDGGALAALGPAAVSASTFHNTTSAGGRGGAVASLSSDVRLDGSSIVLAQAQRGGGAVFASGAALLSGTNVTRATSGPLGGGAVLATTATAASSSFQSCSTTGAGGAIAATSSVTAASSNFSAGSSADVRILRASDPLPLCTAWSLNSPLRVLCRRRLLQGGGFLSAPIVSAAGSNFAGGRTDKAGGCIFASVSATVAGCSLTSCSAASSGGGVMSPAVNATASTFALCSAQAGGALFSPAAVALAGCTFRSNNASRGGHVAVTQAGGQVQASSTTFESGSSVSGGTLYVQGSASGKVSVSLTDSSIVNSAASAITPRGGAITAYFASLALANTSISGCTVSVLAPTVGPFDVQRDLTPFGSGAGGAIFAYASDVQITRGSQARGLLLKCRCHIIPWPLLLASLKRSADAPLSRPQLSLNAASYGGGLYLTGATSTLYVDASTLANNTALATHGGAAYLDNVALASLSGTALVGNVAQTHGGGVLLAGVASAALAGVSASANQARAGSGGAVYADENCTALAVSASAFAANEAVAGPSVFLASWARLLGNGTVAVRQPAPCADCALAGNKASAWGADALFATDVVSARLLVSPPALSSGAAVLAVVQLFDGAR